MTDAIEWVVRLESADDMELNQIWPEFDDWFMSDATHRKAYAGAKRGWDHLNASCTRLPPVPLEDCEVGKNDKDEAP